MKNDGIKNEIKRMTENRMVKSKIKAQGTRGFLIYTMNKEYVFRVYKEDHSFTDYDITHCDLELTINDDDATFYEFKDGRSILDHSYEIAGESHHIDKGYEVGTEEGYNDFIKYMNRL